jgi:hypothetical protein
VSFAPYSWFAQWSDLKVKKRGDEYDSLKNAIGQQIIDQITHLYPDLKVSHLSIQISINGQNRHVISHLDIVCAECHRLF